ncbi:hypothetical protein ES705_41334 [subsurface metagenome]
MGAYVVVSCIKSAFTVVRVGAAVELLTDMLVDAADFPSGRKGRLRIVWKNDGNNTNYMDLYDRFGVAAVAASEESEAMATNVWEVTETTTPFTLPEGIKSFQARLWVSAGTMTVDKIELQVESG